VNFSSAGKPTVGLVEPPEPQLRESPAVPVVELGEDVPRDGQLGSGVGRAAEIERERAAGVQHRRLPSAVGGFEHDGKGHLDGVPPVAEPTARLEQSRHSDGELTAKVGGGEVCRLPECRHETGAFAIQPVERVREDALDPGCG
jgi:hypothetical protein